MVFTIFHYLGGGGLLIPSQIRTCLTLSLACPDCLTPHCPCRGASGPSFASKVASDDSRHFRCRKQDSFTHTIDFISSFCWKSNSNVKLQIIDDTLVLIFKGQVCSASLVLTLIYPQILNGFELTLILDCKNDRLLQKHY